MALGPRVYEDIKEHVRARSRARLLLLLPYLATLALAIALLVWLLPAAIRHGGTPSAVAQPLTGYWVLAIIATGLAISTARLASNLTNGTDAFRQLMANETGDVSLLPFESALDAAAIAAGVSRPRLQAISDPSINALTVSAREGLVVLVTSGSFSWEITAEEKESMMAHELAHVLLKETMRRPTWSNLEFLTDFMFLVITLLVIVDGVLYFLGDVADNLWRPAAGWPLLALLAIWTVVLVLGFSKRFRLRLMAVSHHADDLLADDIAVSITRDPSSLMGAIKKADAYLAGHGRRAVGGGAIARHLFVAPKPVVERHFARLFHNESFDETPVLLLTGDPAIAHHPRDWREIEWELSAEDPDVKARLDNLALIQQGRKRSISDWSVGD